MEIIILAALAGFLIYRLWSVLGQHSDPIEGPGLREPKSSKVHPAFQRPTPIAKTTKDSEAGFSNSLMQLQSADTGFTEESFLEGAQVAYKEIFSARQKGDVNIIKSLCAPKIAQIFKEEIASLKSRDWTNSNELLRILSANITDVHLAAKTAKIKVAFKTEQVLEIRDRKGKLVEGDPDQIEVTQEVWTFSRNLKSSDPNWELVDLVS